MAWPGQGSFYSAGPCLILIVISNESESILNNESNVESGNNIEQESNVGNESNNVVDGGNAGNAVGREVGREVDTEVMVVEALGSPGPAQPSCIVHEVGEAYEECSLSGKFKKMGSRVFRHAIQPNVPPRPPRAACASKAPSGLS